MASRLIYGKGTACEAAYRVSASGNPAVRPVLHRDTFFGRLLDSCNLLAQSLCRRKLIPQDLVADVESSSRSLCLAVVVNLMLQVGSPTAELTSLMRGRRYFRYLPSRSSHVGVKACRSPSVIKVITERPFGIGHNVPGLHRKCISTARACLDCSLCTIGEGLR
jgi:hypothetical protein